MIYFDNAATTFPKPECVYEALDKANRTQAFNAGRGESAESEEATSIISEARSCVASILPGTAPSHVVFTSSATDALNKLILGLDLLDGETVYVSPFEHNAIMRPLRRLQKNGVDVKVLPFDKQTWSLDIQEMKQMFALKKPKAVFISQISNVTGFAVPYWDVFSASKEYGAINVLDAAQGFGVFSIDHPEDCSYIVFAGHKSLYASFGVAGFIVVHDMKIEPVIRGGTGSDSLSADMPECLPGRYEAGSPNVVAISSLIASIKWLKSQNVAEHEDRLAEYFRLHIKAIPKIKIFAPDSIKLHGIVSMAVNGYGASDVGIILSEKGFSIRTGYHCAPLVHDFIGSIPYQGTVRFSFGAFNDENEINGVIKTLEAL